MIPTPSHPTKSWNKLLAVTNTVIVIKNSNRYLKNFSILGSDDIYHKENSIIDQVTNSATDINTKEKKSNLKVTLMENVWILSQFQFEIIPSCPVYNNIEVGIRLIKNDRETIDLTYLGYISCSGNILLGTRIGIIKRTKDKTNEDKNRFRFITFIWSCTNFLVPKTNGYFYPLKARKP